jgi:hypothetical protein
LIDSLDIPQEEEVNMSNSPKNKEQDQLIEQTPTQRNPGAARPTDFAIADRGPGQCDDTKAERAALLAESDADGKSKRGEAIPERNEIPKSRYQE